MSAILDTNVVLDALADREPWNKDAQQLLIRAAKGEDDLYLTGSAITDIYFLLKKHVLHNNQETRRALQVLLDSLGVVSVGKEACVEALHSPIPDYEDAVMAIAAAGEGMEYIITCNTKDLKGSPVPAITPKAYLKKCA